MLKFEIFVKIKWVSICNKCQIFSVRNLTALNNALFWKIKIIFNTQHLIIKALFWIQFPNLKILWTNQEKFFWGSFWELQNAWDYTKYVSCEKHLLSLYSIYCNAAFILFLHKRNHILIIHNSLFKFMF